MHVKGFVTSLLQEIVFDLAKGVYIQSASKLVDKSTDTIWTQPWNRNRKMPSSSSPSSWCSLSPVKSLLMSSVGQTVHDILSSTGVPVGRVSTLWHNHYFRASQVIWWSSKEASPLWTPQWHSLYWIWEADTAIWMAKMLSNMNNTTISFRPGHSTLKESGMKVVIKQKGLTLSQNIGEGGWTLLPRTETGLLRAGRGSFG